MNILRAAMLTIFIALSVSACGSSASPHNPSAGPSVSVPTSRPLPTAHSGPLPVLPLAKVEKLIAYFNRAVLENRLSAARAYLTTALRAHTSAPQLSRDLGLRSGSRGATYQIVAVTTKKATINISYFFASKTIHDQLSVVQVGTGKKAVWRIGGIKRLK